jgi:hypothetical protein
VTTERRQRRTTEADDDGNDDDGNDGDGDDGEDEEESE